MNASDTNSAPSRGPLPKWARLIGALAFAAFAVWLLRENAGASREASWMGGIFVLAALLWVTEALPLFATSLLVIGLQIVLLANPGGWNGLGFASGKSPLVP